MCLRQLQHRLYKIVAIAVEPCSTDDEELFCKLLNKFLTGKLGHTISTLRIRVSNSVYGLVPFPLNT